VPAIIASNANELRGADRIILPGVGAFDHAMKRLNQSGMRELIEEMVLVRKMPFLGICVGMQMLARRSDEGTMNGLGWVDGEVRRFDTSKFSAKTHLPHMGWNNVQPSRASRLFKDLEANARFYFLHSYYFAPNKVDNVLAVTNYNGDYASSIGLENIFGVQFHPEKSHQWGIQLLMNFSEL
jgi:glutamine amidotransferase